MKIDLHCHAAGRGKNLQETDREIYFNVEDDSSWLTRRFYTFFYSVMERKLAALGAGRKDDEGGVSTDEYFEILYTILAASREIDGVVVLALDAVYDDRGSPDIRRTDLWVSNRFLYDRVKRLNDRLRENEYPHKRFFFGASVNPNNRNWQAELDFVVNDTDAVLIKWIPSAQHIKVQEVSVDFYRRLAEKDMPLLIHVGPEHTFPEGLRNKENDHFRHLQRPLDAGVRIIAGHCNTPSIPLVEKNEISEFCRFMEKTNRDDVRLFADTAALSSLTKFRYIKDIAREFNPEWLVHGSDFPIPVEGWVNIPLVNPRISLDEYKQITQTKNPLDLDVLIKRAHGLSDRILENGQAVMRYRRS